MNVSDKQAEEQEQRVKAKPQQEEMPFAYVQGAPVTQLPQDLYIPPEALEVFLEAFEGPLDLLLYLIKRQNLDILDIPIAEITEQYVKYVDLMQDFQFELASEYLVMAAMLAEIKSRMLLPRPELIDEEESDPRAELIRRLQEYERFKKAAMDIDELPRMGRDVFPVSSDIDYTSPAQQPDISMQELMLALKDVMARASMFTHHNIERETLSVRERMSIVLERVSSSGFTRFTSLFTYEEGRGGVVVTFLAILELSKQRLLEIVQTETYGAIHVKPLADSSLEGDDNED
ncbi:MAG: segregation/condensation protein A [gamma proteobacterium symbiont of Lucinoma myriamae]|nr:segregation/condensation protein A [gamma proteobacterium symbiont of Lucinoma myriamae]MCU7819158.1 segregation/condensation protein A [gamma proteobacterium symbiont of Lucinoma myriamae]MCU7832071.1 segregation/condensation protein A [gamma proteobacterium symbiont of Lucinoma myriamae]